jgi:HEAT repeat protein
MVFDKWVTEIKNHTEKNQQKEAIEYAQKCSSEEMVKVLCQVAIETMDHEVRCAILGILKTKHLDTAADMFADYADTGSVRQRKWAFVNLCLMECKTKRKIVLKGLKDPSVYVRRSAALNAGLYQDDSFIKELVIYFETNSNDFLHELALRGFERFIFSIKRMKTVDKNYSEP